MLVQRLQAAALLLGPLTFAASPFFWTDGHYGVNGGTLIALAMVPWVYGLVGEYERLRERVPRAAGLWLLLLLVGMFGSVSFGLQGFFEQALDAVDRVALAGFADYPPQSLLVLWLPGPAFPLARLVFGVLLGWTRTAPWWVAVLICLAAVAFPLGRVLRLEWVAYVVDVLVLVPFGYLARRAWRRPAPAAPAP
ncbi:hypothetical protein ACFPZ0_14580 [Streptomonospora nanhaiensis]|uniref:Uncharacterized protein n=1 Tax=Streptomonospora nanhaiensis TaxID=1323731 RepID=A0A853BW24_9ACTN|nr:hypothetical protein [Streptomonospora nanhaiensis]MBX9390594.1 hypothetical protein [Streptomonospora nanhaiensis]NYI99180.1 hypothetical protein [Streptomonospora nanhaiensis]